MSLHIQRPTKAAPLSAYAHRVAALEALFTTIAHTRMAGVPVMNHALRVQALGLSRCPCRCNKARHRPHQHQRLRSGS